LILKVKLRGEFLIFSALLSPLWRGGYCAAAEFGVVGEVSDHLIALVWRWLAVSVSAVDQARRSAASMRRAIERAQRWP
jgi:hypothetical protein